MLTNTNPSSMEQGITSKHSISNTSNGNTNNRYSPSNFYRAAAVAAATSDSNNRRYMPSSPVDYFLHNIENLFLFPSGPNQIVLVIVLNSNQM
jgi:hypothetical protein